MKPYRCTANPKDCHLPESEHGFCWAKSVEHECYGALWEQHYPKRSAGGHEIVAILCAHITDAIDNSQKILAAGKIRRLGNDVQGRNGKRFFRIFDKDEEHREAGWALLWKEIPNGATQASVGAVDGDDGRRDGGRPPDRAEVLPDVQGLALSAGASTEVGWSALDLLKQFVTPTGCNLPDNMPYDLWLRFMSAIGEVHMASEWTVGDAYLFGEDHYGEQASQGEVAAGRSPKRLLNITRICGIIPPESRLKGIRSFSVFEVIAPVYFRDAEEGLALLKEAEAEKWSGEEAKAILDERGLRPKAKEKAAPETTYTLPVLRERFAAWPERQQFKNNLNKGAAAFWDYLE